MSIKGYRVLTANEVAAINSIKTAESASMEIISHMKRALADARVAIDKTGDATEIARFNAAEPERWLAIGKTHLQQGFMAITRSIAQPGE